MAPDQVTELSNSYLAQVASEHTRVSNPNPVQIHCRIVFQYHGTPVPQRSGTDNFSRLLIIGNEGSIKSIINMNINNGGGTCYSNGRNSAVVRFLIKGTPNSDYLYASYKGYSAYMVLQHEMTINFTMPDTFRHTILQAGGGIQQIIFIGGCFRLNTVASTVIHQLPYQWQRTIVIMRNNRVMFNRVAENSSVPNPKIRIPLSLGGRGRLLIRFSNPVIRIEVVEYVRGEQFEIRFGDDPLLTGRAQLPDGDPRKRTGAPGYPDDQEGEFVNPVGFDYNYRANNGKCDTPHNWVEIRDNSSWTSLDNQNPYYPGLDIEQLIATRHIKNLVVVLDISGSMSDNDPDSENIEGGDYYRSNDPVKKNIPAPNFNERLYHRAGEAIKNELLPSNENHAIQNVTLVTFYGKKDSATDPVTLNVYENLNTSTRLSNTLDEVMRSLRETNRLYDGTPLASAIRKGFEVVSRNSVTEDANMILVITDGAGENESEKIDDIETLPTIQGSVSIELVGYKIHPIAGRNLLLGFSPTVRSDYAVQKYDVTRYYQLNELVKGIAQKYGFRK